MDENLEQRSHWFTVYTLVDITKTDVLTNSHVILKDTDTNFKRNQQRNWETVKQVLGLRAQPIDITKPITVVANSKEFSFGTEYAKKKQTIWKFSFCVEHADVYNIDNNAVAGLEEDFNKVPVILGLTETAKPPVAIFYSDGPSKNICFMFGKV